MTTYACYLQLLVASFVLVAVAKTEEIAHGTLEKYAPGYDELYADGMNAYNKEEWQTAVAKFEEAIADWKRERSVTLNCRAKCKSAFDAKRDERANDFAMDYLRYMTHMRNCSQECLTKDMGLRLMISRHVRHFFENRGPYSFLQYSYYMAGNVEMALKSALTFLRFRPKDEVVLRNKDYYLELPELQDLNVDELESLSPIEHYELYEKGRKAYNAQDWKKTVEYFEAALKEYTKAYKECQTLCEMEIEKRQQHIPGGVYAYHTQLLYCRLDCPRKLSKLFNYPQPGHLGNHYDFLQYSYLQLNKIEESIPCALTVLLLNPGHERMKATMEYYINQGYLPSNYEPREDGRFLYEDIRKQMKLLFDVKAYLIDLDEEYKGRDNLDDTTYEEYAKYGMFPDEQIPTAEPEETKDEEKEQDNTEEDGKRKENKTDNEKKAEIDDEPYKRFPLPTKEHIENFLKNNKGFESASLEMMERQLNGSHRVVIDGVASKQECEKLMNLGLTMGQAGDGYSNKPSPHTVKEEFLGVNINNATWAAAKGEISLETAELYVNLSKKVQKLTEVYFKLTTPLYFSYTHLVCRKAISDPAAKGMHISHPVHSDNCILDKDGEVVTCKKEHPAYTWRDYSAILYLNDNFTGGQFIFATQNQTVEAIVKPKCGRMVAFSAGFENLHGVLGIKKGTRCSLPVWFTLDEEYDEKQRYEADEILENLRRSKYSETAGDSKSAKSDHKEL